MPGLGLGHRIATECLGPIVEPGRADEFVVAATGDAGEQSFEHAFRTGSNEYYLNRITLTHAGADAAWLTALSLRETDGGPNLLGDADPNLPRRGIYHQIDAFMLDEIVEAARENGADLTAPVFSHDIACRVVQREAR